MAQKPAQDKLSNPQAYAIYIGITRNRGKYSNHDLRVYRSLSDKAAVEFRTVTLRPGANGKPLEGARIVITQRGYELAVAHYGDSKIGQEIRAAWAKLYPAEATEEATE